MNALTALGINSGNLLISTICLAIAYLIIAQFILKPIRERANERQAEIDQGLENARKAQRLIADAEAQAAAILD